MFGNKNDKKQHIICHIRNIQACQRVDFWKQRVLVRDGFYVLEMNVFGCTMYLVRANEYWINGVIDLLLTAVGSPLFTCNVNFWRRSVI